jgi:hypothetical protein
MELLEQISSENNFNAQFVEGEDKQIDRGRRRNRRKTGRIVKALMKLADRRTKTK